VLAWFRRYPGFEALRAIFATLLGAISAPLAPGVQVPKELLELRNMRATRAEKLCTSVSGPPLSAWLLVMSYGIAPEQLLSKVELSGASTFRASDALASDDICGEASTINLTRATASSAGNLLDDR
jgi:hypothetical protein